MTSLSPLPASRKSSVIRLGRYVLSILFLLLAVRLILPQITTLNHSRQALQGMRTWVLALAALAQLCSYLGSGLLLKAIAAVTGQRLSAVRGASIYAAAVSVSMVAGGAVAYVAAVYRWLRGSGVNGQGALLGGWLPTVLYDAVEAFVAVFGLLHLMVRHQLNALEAVGFSLIVSAVALVIGVIVWGLRHRPQLTNLAVRIAHRWAVLWRRPYDRATTEASTGRWFDAWDTMGSGGWRGPVVGAVVAIAFDMVTLYLVFLAAGHAVRPEVLLLGYGLPLLLGKVSFLPGGVGIVEATMAALYTSLGVPGPVTAIVVLGYRVLSFWLPLLVGLPLIPYLHRTSNAQSQANSAVTQDR